MANNLLAEPDQRPLLVYLPRSYFIEFEKRYPVVYYLLDFGLLTIPGGMALEGLDADVESGFAKEMILVIIDGVNALGGSFYVNSPVTGNWDDFVTRDVVSYVDHHYRTLPAPASRGISGYNVGGFGALNLAMLHPDVFGAVYSLDPAMFDDTGLEESPVFAPPGIVDDFINLEARERLLTVDEALADMKRTTGDLQFTLAYGASFAPNPQAGPPYIDYPYSRQNGRLFRDESTWQRWDAGLGDLPDKIITYQDNLLKLRALAIDYGDDSRQHWIQRGGQYFSEKLTAAEIPHQLIHFAGDHEADLERDLRLFVLPFFSEELVFDEQQLTIDHP